MFLEAPMIGIPAEKWTKQINTVDSIRIEQQASKRLNSLRSYTQTSFLH